MAVVKSHHSISVKCSRYQDTGPTDPSLVYNNTTGWIFMQKIKSWVLVQFFGSSVYKTIIKLNLDTILLGGHRRLYQGYQLATQLLHLHKNKPDKEGMLFVLVLLQS